YVRSEAFFRVFTLEQQLLIFTFDRQSRFHWNLPARLHGALDAAYGLCSLVGWAELAGVLHDVLHEAVALVDVVDHAEFQSLFERKSITGDHQLDGFTLPHQPRQSLRAASPGKDAEIHFGQADLSRIFARDAKVSGHGDLETSTNAVAVDRGDHQLWRVFEPQERLVRVQAKVVLERRIDGRQHLDIRARREELVAIACQHHHVDVVIHADRKSVV